MIHPFLLFLLAHLGGLVKFFAGAFVAVLADPLKIFITRPRLKFDFEHNDHFVTLSHQMDGQAKVQGYYVRVGVRNTSNRTAKACRVYLTNLEQLGADGKWIATTYAESFQLSWVGPSEMRLTAYDLPGKTRRLCDVVSTSEYSGMFYLPLEAVLNRFPQLSTEKKTIRLTLRVTGNDVRGDSLMLKFVWKGIWDDFGIEREST